MCIRYGSFTLRKILNVTTLILPFNSDYSSKQGSVCKKGKAKIKNVPKSLNFNSLHKVLADKKRVESSAVWVCGKYNSHVRQTVQLRSRQHCPEKNLQPKGDKTI